jgi:MFS family permease
MVDENAPPVMTTVDNQTEFTKKLLYTDAQTSWLFSATAIGTLLGTIPLSFLTNRFGFR